MGVAVLDKWHEIFTLYFCEHIFSLYVKNALLSLLLPLLLCKKRISLSPSSVLSFFMEAFFLSILDVTHNNHSSSNQVGWRRHWLGSQFCFHLPVRSQATQPVWASVSLGSEAVRKGFFKVYVILMARAVIFSRSAALPTPPLSSEDPSPALYGKLPALCSGSTHLSHVGAADTDGQQRPFIPPQICSILGLLSAISHLRLVFVI